MTARHLVALGITALGLTLAAPAASLAAAPAGHARRGVNARERRQAHRVREGVTGGELTKGERDRIRGDEKAIRAEERVYRRSGGALSRGERRDLQKDLDKTSREIHRDKHNARTP